MTFHADIRRFATADDLAVYLATLPRPTWTKGSCYHNSYVPTEATWAGEATMRSMMNHYISLGWTAGPHFFVVVGSRKPDWDGIWQLTPPTAPGIHAGQCNSDRFGLEVVGNFQSRPMSAQQISLLVDTAAALHEWAGLPTNIVAHRDCMPGRTCPGDAAYAQKPVIQARLAAALTPPYTADSPILGAPYATVVFPPSPNYTDEDIDTILSAYWTQSVAVGLDPVLAIAQMAHETGALSSFWSARPQRNPAGLGVNGQIRYTKPATPNWAYNTQRRRWEMGISFKAWVSESIPAHIGRLLAYALTDAQATPEQAALIDFALSVRPLPPSYRGCAPTIKGLNGTWAFPGVGYSARIAAWANRLAGAV